MPHLVLEYSSNVIEKNNIKNLFEECHSLLATTLPTDIANCKSRGMECDVYCLGDGNADNAFVHLTLKILAGRSQEKLKEVGEAIMTSLQAYFSESLKILNLQISIEIVELQKTYFKI